MTGKRRRKLAEWVTLTVCATVVFGLAGYLIYAASRGDPEIVTISIELQPAQRAGDQYVLPCIVSNQSWRTARGVQLQLHESPSSGKENTQDAAIDFLAERSQQKVFFILPEDPAGKKLEARAVSYLLD